MSPPGFGDYVQPSEIHALDRSTRCETEGDAPPGDRPPLHARPAIANSQCRRARAAGRGEAMSRRTPAFGVKPAPPDARIDARDENPRSDAGVPYRARRLVSIRTRRRIAASLELICDGRPELARLSAAAPVDERAVEIARPALLQLARALRSRAGVEPRGVALAYALVTDPYSALYRPAYRDELYEIARETLFALGPNLAGTRTERATSRGRPQVRPCA